MSLILFNHRRINIYELLRTCIQTSNSMYMTPSVLVFKMLVLDARSPLHLDSTDLKPPSNKSLFANFITLRSKYSTQYPIFKNVFFGPSLKVKDKVSHPYKTVEKIILMYILNFICLDSKQRHKIVHRMIASIK